LSVGFTEIDITDLRIEHAGGVLVLPSLQAELPLLYAGFSHKLMIRRLAAAGWTLDVSRARLAGLAREPVVRPSQPFSLVPPAYADSTATAAVFQVFEGLFHRLQLPVDLQLDGLGLEGDVLLPPAPGYASARVHGVLSGGGLAAGREGQFAFSLRATSPVADGAAGTVTADGTLVAAMDTPRTFGRLAVKIEAAASGGKFPAGVKLAVNIRAERAAGNESYLLTLAGENKILVAVQTNFSANSHRVAGTWKLDVSDDDIAPFVLGHALPSFVAAGEGRFDTDAALGMLHLSGQIEATLDRLGLVRPELAAVGAVKLTAEFDLADSNGEFRVDRLTAALAGAEPIAEVRALQPFAFNVRTGVLEVADPARDLLGIALEDVPIGWSEPFLSGVVLTGDGLRGKFVASARDGGLALRSSGPVEISGLSVTRRGQTVLSGVEVAVDLSAGYTPQGWQVDIAPCIVRRGGASLLSVRATAGRLAGENQPMKVAGRISAYLPALLSWPPSGQWPVLTSGDFDGQFTASIAQVSAYQAVFKLSGLAAGDSIGGDVPALPTIAAEMRADVDADGKWTLLAPIALECEGRKSDLTIAGTIDPRKADSTLDGQVTSSVLFARDAKVLGAILAAKEWISASVSDPPASSIASPTELLWPLSSGRVVLALRKVRLEHAEWDDVRGRVLIMPAALVFEDVHAGLGAGGDLSASGTLNFAPGETEPYSWRADLAVSDFDYGAYSRAQFPEHPPTIDGKFKITCQLLGDGSGLADLTDRVQGVLQLSSKGGVFRALRADVADSLKQSPALISQALDSVGSLFGIKEDKTAAAKQLIDKQGKIVVALANRLQEVPYDQIDVTARRDADLNVHITEFALIAPELRLSGTGQIAYQKDVPVVEQPLVFDGQLDARGRTADLLGSIGLLSAQQDDLGYTRMTEPFHLGGSLDDIDGSQWQEMLVKAAMHKAAGGLLDKLLGK